MSDQTQSPVKYLTDDNGNKSAMRIMSACALAVASILAFSEAFGWGSGDGNAQLILYFLMAAFVPKAVQKFAETE